MARRRGFGAMGRKLELEISQRNYMVTVSGGPGASELHGPAATALPGVGPLVIYPPDPTGFVMLRFATRTTDVYTVTAQITLHRLMEAAQVRANLRCGWAFTEPLDARYPASFIDPNNVDDLVLHYSDGAHHELLVWLDTLLEAGHEPTLYWLRASANAMQVPGSDGQIRFYLYGPLGKPRIVDNAEVPNDEPLMRLDGALWDLDAGNRRLEISSRGLWIIHPRTAPVDPLTSQMQALDRLYHPMTCRLFEQAVWYCYRNQLDLLVSADTDDREEGNLSAIWVEILKAQQTVGSTGRPVPLFRVSSTHTTATTYVSLLYDHRLQPPVAFQ